MTTESWQTFKRLPFSLRFDHPPLTPQGYPAEISLDMKEEAHRVHLHTPDSPELYFEVTRYTQLQAETGYALLTEILAQRAGNFQASTVTHTKVAGQAACIFDFKIADLERRVIFIQRGMPLYRILYDPRSAHNEQVLATLHFQAE